MYCDNEPDLLRGVSAGNHEAFHTLYQRYRKQVFYFGMKFLKSESAAEDVLQEVFSKIWINREMLGQLISFSKYLNTLTLNHIYNLLKRKAHEESFLQKEFIKIKSGAQPPFTYVDLHALEGLLACAVSQLPPQQKKVFELSRMQRLPHKDIALQLNISGETVKKHIMEALRNVKAYLAAHGEVVVNIAAIFFLLK